MKLTYGLLFVYIGRVVRVADYLGPSGHLVGLWPTMLFVRFCSDIFALDLSRRFVQSMLSWRWNTAVLAGTVRALRNIANTLERTDISQYC